jgi:hypothetical protein
MDLYQSVRPPNQARLGAAPKSNTKRDHLILVFSQSDRLGALGLIRP